ncbi:MAG: LD-carboxypeptidase [Alphaproteobacteria bacterium]
MGNKAMKIGVVAPGSRLERAHAERIAVIARQQFRERAPEIVFHPQCFLSSGHFAGDDETRANALLEFANDATFDAVWFARGGYGACRLLDRVLPRLGDVAKAKMFLGYSDAGALLGALYARGFARLAHGPMPSDLAREGGEKAVARALSFLADGDTQTFEPHVSRTRPAVAFNLTIFATLAGTPFQPALADHILMLEEVGEYMYRIDRTLFHVTSNPDVRKVAGIMLGRCDSIPANDPDFRQTEDEVVQHWCRASGIPYLGRADIGHDIDNKIVPFGLSWPRLS